MGVIIIPLLQIRALRVRKLKQNHSPLVNTLWMTVTDFCAQCLHLGPEHSHPTLWEPTVTMERSIQGNRPLQRAKDNTDKNKGWYKVRYKDKE